LSNKKDNYVQNRCISHAMNKVDKTKVEVYLVNPVKTEFQTICDKKGITDAEGLRRAIELWMKHESDS